jgi:diacylglycerol kinase family enzyme
VEERADIGEDGTGPQGAPAGGSGALDAGRAAPVAEIPGQQCAVVLNAGAGSLLGEEDAHRSLEELFTRHGLVPRVKICDQGEEIDGFVRESLESGIRTIVAGGGDGTVSTVASRLIDTDATLGVLPLGTLNHFAKDLGLPLDRDDAVAAIAGGRRVRVDVGEVNGTIFINNSSLGLYPLAVRLREQEQERGTGKWLALAKASLDVLGRYPLLRVHMTIDGREIVRRTPIVFIGNNHYELEGFAMSRRERLDEGVLSICVTRDVGRFGLFGLLFRALVGRLRDARDFSVLEGRELWIETPRRQLRVATDGETTMMETPLRYCSRAGALSVIVPAQQSSDDVEPKP